VKKLSPIPTIQLWSKLWLWLNAVALHRKPISELRSVTRRTGSQCLPATRHRWMRPALCLSPAR